PSTGTRPTQDSPTSFVMGVTRRLTSKRRGRPSPMRVLCISGSLRRDSHNTKLLRHGRELFEAEGVEFEIYDGLKDIPPYDEDDDSEDAPEAVSRIREAVLAADAVFFTTPEYNSSIPGALKNASTGCRGRSPPT